MARLGSIGGDIEQAIEEVNVPSYIIDSTGIIRWINPCAERLVGDVRGRQFTSVVSPEEKRRSQEVFAKNVAGKANVTDVGVVLLDEAGERVAVEISSVPLRDGNRIVGIFGQVSHVPAEPPAPPHPALTPRQGEVLRLLEHGRSTGEIAEELHLSRETVRNHIRHLLRNLGVHSRLEAVAVARHEHLLAAN
jgi:PAS domain S-box-containing protein